MDLGDMNCLMIAQKINYRLILLMSSILCSKILLVVAKTSDALNTTIIVSSKYFMQYLKRQHSLEKLLAKKFKTFLTLILITPSKVKKVKKRVGQIGVRNEFEIVENDIGY